MSLSVSSFAPIDGRVPFSLPPMVNKTTGHSDTVEFPLHPHEIKMEPYDPEDSSSVETKPDPFVCPPFAAPTIHTNTNEFLINSQKIKTEPCDEDSSVEMKPDPLVCPSTTAPSSAPSPPPPSSDLIDASVDVAKNMKKRTRRNDLVPLIPPFQMKLQNNNKKQCWWLILETLMNVEKRNVVGWTGRGIEFRILDREAFNELWRVENGRVEAVQWESIARAIRLSYRLKRNTEGMLAPSLSKQENTWRFSSVQWAAAALEIPVETLQLFIEGTNLSLPSIDSSSLPSIVPPVATRHRGRLYAPASSISTDSSPSPSPPPSSSSPPPSTLFLTPPFSAESPPSKKRKISQELSLPSSSLPKKRPRKVSTKEVPPLSPSKVLGKTVVTRIIDDWVADFFNQTPSDPGLPSPPFLPSFPIPFAPRQSKQRKSIEEVCADILKQALLNNVNDC